MRTLLRLVPAYLTLSLFIGLIWAAWSYPELPSTAGGWLTIFALALPAQLALEFAGELWWNNRMTRYVDKETASTSLSLVRIAYGVALMLVLVGLLFGAAYGWQALEALLGL